MRGNISAEECATEGERRCYSAKENLGTVELGGLSEEFLQEQGRLLFARPWRFLCSVLELRDLSRVAAGTEIAFAGRSNVGKSTLLNSLVGQRNLARTSCQPGRTQCLNFFVGAHTPLRLVDMPGYGYAEAPRRLTRRWQALMLSYLQERPGLVRVFLLIDSRRGLTELDWDVLALFDTRGISYQILLTKTDCLKPDSLQEMRTLLSSELGQHPAAAGTVLESSSKRKEGLTLLRTEIARLLASLKLL